MIKESKGSVVRARCSVELKQRVIAFAERFGIEEADVIRMSLEDYIERNEAAPALEFKRPAIVKVQQVLETAVDVARSRKRAANPKP